MIHAERTEQGTVHCQDRGGGEQVLEETVAVMAHMGNLIARKTGCTPEAALELLKAFAYIQMRNGATTGEEARPS